MAYTIKVALTETMTQLLQSLLPLFSIGRVLGCPSLSRVEVHFTDGHCQSTVLSQLVVMGGAGPRPPLQVGDHALCCVRGRPGWHCSQHGLSDFYVPSQVQVSGRGTWYGSMHAQFFPSCRLCRWILDVAMLCTQSQHSVVEQ